MNKRVILFFLFFIFALSGYYSIFHQRNNKVIKVSVLGKELEKIEYLANEFNKTSKVKIEVEDSHYFNFVFVILEKYKKRETIPDIFMIVYDQIPELADNGVILPINPEDISNVFPLAKESVYYKNKYYAYPFSSESLFIFYNKKLITPSAWSVDEYIKYGIKLKKEKNIEWLTFSTDEYYYQFPWYSYFGGKQNDLISPNKEVLTRIAKEVAFTSKLFKYADFNISSSLFKNSQSAMVMSGN